MATTAARRIRPVGSTGGRGPRGMPCERAADRTGS